MHHQLFDITIGIQNAIVEHDVYYRFERFGKGFQAGNVVFQSRLISSKLASFVANCIGIEDTYKIYDITVSTTHHAQPKPSQKISISTRSATTGFKNGE